MAILIGLFIVVPIAELFVIVKVGELIGVLPTLALLLADALLGALLLRHQGRGAWRRFNVALQQRRLPAREAADGVLIVLGGSLLLAPGFITDVFGALLLIPPTRALARGLLRRWTIGRFAVVGFPGGFGAGRGPRPSAPRAGRGPAEARPYDVDASAEEVPVNGDGERRLPGGDDR